MQKSKQKTPIMRNLDIGPGSTAKVSLINTAFLRNIPTEPFIQPSVPGYSSLDVPSFAFLIEQHDTKKKVMFDLGLREDWQNSSPIITNMIEKFDFRIEIQDEVARTLQSRGGISPGEIDAVVLRSVSSSIKPYIIACS